METAEEFDMRKCVLGLYDMVGIIPSFLSELMADPMQADFGVTEFVLLNGMDSRRLTPRQFSLGMSHALSSSVFPTPAIYLLPKLCDVASYMDIDISCFDWFNSGGDPAIPLTEYLVYVFHKTWDHLNEIQKKHFALWAKVWWKATLNYDLPDSALYNPWSCDIPISRSSENVIWINSIDGGGIIEACSVWDSYGNMVALKHFIRFVLHYKQELLGDKNVVKSKMDDDRDRVVVFSWLKRSKFFFEMGQSRRWGIDFEVIKECHDIIRMARF